MNSSQWTRRGVTLIELLIVVAIVVILGATVPMLTSGVVVERQMYNTAAQLQQDLLLVQNMAITHSSGGPRTPTPLVEDKTWFTMRLYLSSNAFAYQTTEGAAALPASSPVPGNGITVRSMSSTFGFPAFFGNPASVASVTIGPTGSSAGVTTGYVHVVFDNQGLAYWSANGASFTQTTGSIMITNSSASKRIQVTVSVIGRVSIAWVPGYR